MLAESQKIMHWIWQLKKSHIKETFQTPAILQAYMILPITL